MSLNKHFIFANLKSKYQNLCLSTIDNYLLNSFVKTKLDRDELGITKGKLNHMGC